MSGAQMQAHGTTVVICSHVGLQFMQTAFFCQRVVCGMHLMRCYCEIRIYNDPRFISYRRSKEMSEKLANKQEILRGVPGSSGSSKDNPRSGLEKLWSRG